MLQVLNKHWQSWPDCDFLENITRNKIFDSFMSPQEYVFQHKHPTPYTQCQDGLPLTWKIRERLDSHRLGPWGLKVSLKPGDTQAPGDLIVVGETQETGKDAKSRRGCWKSEDQLCSEQQTGRKSKCLI